MAKLWVLREQKKARHLCGGFTLIELLAVLALLVIAGALVYPQLASAWVEWNLLAEARYAHALAQGVRQQAIMQSRNMRIEYVNSVPARIRVVDAALGTAVPGFAERVLPLGMALLPVSPLSKSVTFNTRGEATWLPNVGTPNRIIIRASNGQERHLLFHSAGRIMLVVP